MEKVGKMYLTALALEIFIAIVALVFNIKPLRHFADLFALVLITIFLFGVVYFIWKH